MLCGKCWAGFLIDGDLDALICQKQKGRDSDPMGMRADAGLLRRDGQLCKKLVKIAYNKVVVSDR